MKILRASLIISFFLLSAWAEENIGYLRKLVNKANSGDANAQYELGDCYYSGEGVPQDYNEAVKWWKKSAEQGNANAQCGLGIIYLKEAAKYFSKSAEQGNALGQRNIGICYHVGVGVDQDYNKAVKWFKKSAEQGDDVSQYNLGLALAKGEGIREDRDEAIKWYIKSAAQENSEALKILKLK